MKYSVYSLSDPNGVIRYIGKSVNPDKRLRAHIQQAKTGSSCLSSVWIRSLLERRRRPVMAILFESGDEAQVFAKEIELIAFHREAGAALCNISEGGEGRCGRRVSMETRLLQSMARKGRKMPQFTAEHRHNLSLARRGKPGHPHTPESRAKISNKQKGRPKSLAERVALAYARTRFSRRETAEIAFQKSRNVSIAKLAKQYGVSLCCIQKAVRRYEMEQSLDL